MIVKTESEFLEAFSPGDTIYYTRLWRDRPTEIVEVPYVRLSTVREEYPNIANSHSDPECKMICETHIRGTYQVEYIETMLMTNRICATTRQEAEQGLRALKWLYANDVRGLEEIQYEWNRMGFIFTI